MNFRDERKGLFLTFLALLVPSCSAYLCPCLIANICVLLFEFIVLDFHVILVYYFLLWNSPLLVFFGGGGGGILRFF